MSKIVLGKDESGRDVRLDLDKLVTTRLLIQGNSGGGKSWTIRRLLEQSHGKIQHIVLDPEGEFSTLREKYDYVLVGKGGEVGTDVRHAPKLAERLMELGASAVVDLYELKPDARRQYVSVFLDALVNLPKHLWHPVLVVVDEAHVYCPEKGSGEAQSTESVKDLVTRGRKRGLAAVLATQRISKLHKDTAAECRNRLIGLSVIDVDRDRSAEELGWHRNRDAALRLRDLEPGEFYAFGPALTNDVRRVRIGGVETSHPEIGTKAAPPPPPREKVRAMLSKLADLPKEAEEERQTVDSLNRRIRELQAELRQRPKVEVPEVKVERVEVPILKPEQIANLNRAADSVAKSATNLASEAQAVRAAIASSNAARPIPRPIRPTVAPIRSIARPINPGFLGDQGSPDLSGPERKLLSVLAQYPKGRTVTQLALLAGYAKDGGAFRNPLGSLRSKGFIEGKDVLRIAQSGLGALGDWEPLPEPGSELLAYWMGRLSGPEREIVRVLSESWPDTLTANEVAAKSLSSKGGPYDPDGGAFRNPLGRLRTLELVVGRGDLKLNDDLKQG